MLQRYYGDLNTNAERCSHLRLRKTRFEARRCKSVQCLDASPGGDSEAFCCRPQFGSVGVYVGKKHCVQICQGVCVCTSEEM